jgi:hypothetical protein
VEIVRSRLECYFGLGRDVIGRGRLLIPTCLSASQTLGLNRFRREGSGGEGPGRIGNAE